MRCIVLYVGPDGNSHIGHHKMELKDPARYAAALARDGHRSQIVDLDTSEMYGDLEARCPHCDAKHIPPYDGSCLI